MVILLLDCAHNELVRLNVFCYFFLQVLEFCIILLLV